MISDLRRSYLNGLTDPVINFDLTGLRDMQQVEMTWMEDGRQVIYTGVPLANLLRSTIDDLDSMHVLESMSASVLLVQGRDGFRSAVSACSAGMDPYGSRLFLALSRDGMPLGTTQGPVRLIVWDDPKHIRWVKQVDSIRLVRLN